VRRTARIAVGVLLAAAGCRSLPLGELAPLAPDDARPGILLASLDERAAARQALRGRAHLAVDSDDGEVQLRGSQVLAVARPDRLRVEVQGFLSQTQAVLVTDRGAFQFFVPAEGTFESGAVYRGLLWQVARIDLEPTQVVDLVLGAPLPDRRLELRRALTTPEGGVRIELADAGGSRRDALVFDAEARLRRFERHAGGERLWQVRFDDYAAVDGTPFAHRIQLDFDGSGTRVELSLRDVELNPRLSDGLFRLESPRA